ncbi:SIR2 family protein [Vibrio harveyi]|uniref:SIR2 family protein n=1 Tax=Vibrio harveyi TaxID=669 RepID=UPI0038CD2DDB
MILSSVNFPTKLVEAAEQGNLVIFAGAGVSMGEPANLPSFWKLAEDIAQGFGHQPKEPLDQFLGSLSPNESVIQNATVNALQSIESQPKELHSHLLNMFASSESVRVVTTNFDPLFTEASNDIWPNMPEIYTAPALPLGYDFEGIVHIHGANTHPRSIVITDRGFGQAYLTDGWASRTARAF